ncbi:MAG: VIT1/CCC1 transporter family protein [Anaerolineae bacterium]|nr:VIT1/CCC1 transporter family protein [Anaerolineae bacterium]
MAQTTDIQRYRDNWQDEINSAYLYRTLATLEKQPQLAEVYRRLAATEEAHIGFWEERLREAKQTVPARSPGWRPRTLAWLARRFGPGLILPTMANLEQIGGHTYSTQPEASGGMSRQERSHKRLLETILGGSGSGAEGGLLARFEGRHRAVGGNALRAAVLGANDGLVSNLSLVMGVAGAELSGQAVLVTGLAGLLAGAISMALGEWLSVQSSRELYQRQIRIETLEVQNVPDEEEAELALIYQAKGLPEEQARQLAARLVSDPTTAVDTLAREELGVNPEELGGSAWEAALTSFLLFAIGAVIPVAPFALFQGMTAVVISLVVSGIGLFVIGAAITLMTGRSVLFSGSRQVFFGLAAAAITFGIGRLVGVSISG